MSRRDPVTRNCTVYGVGLGPGDPGLITLKAAEAVNNADCVFFPVARGGAHARAHEIVEAAGLTPKRMRSLIFPMTKSDKALEDAWARAAEAVGMELTDGETGVFITLGDTGIYSTWSYLRRALGQLMPPIPTATIAGVPAFAAAAAELDSDLVLKQDKMLLAPCPENREDFFAQYQSCDTLVYYKIGRCFDELKAWVQTLASMPEILFASRVGSKDQILSRRIPDDTQEVSGALSLLILKKGRAAEREDEA